MRFEKTVSYFHRFKPIFFNKANFSLFCELKNFYNLFYFWEKMQKKHSIADNDLFGNLVWKTIALEPPKGIVTSICLKIIFSKKDIFLKMQSPPVSFWGQLNKFLMFFRCNKSIWQHNFTILVTFFQSITL